MAAPLDPIAQFEVDWNRSRRKRRKKHRTQVDFESPFVQAALDQKPLISSRLDPEIGFHWVGGKIGEYFVAPVSEVGLRTEKPDAHVLRRFVQLAPRVRRDRSGLHAGYDKGQIGVASSKILGLDQPYIQLNPTMRGGWRIDLDRDWMSWDELRFDLECTVDDYQLPCLPHAVVAWESPTGQVRRPHLWFLLPYMSSVWWAPDDPRCRARPMAFYRSVVAGCTAALAPLGADASAAALPLKGKNPLSPLWTFRTWNQHHFPNLAEWADYVDTRQNPGKLARNAAAKSGGSAGEFSTLQHIAYARLRALHDADEPDYRAALDDRAALAAILLMRCRHEIAGMTDKHAERRRLFAIARRVMPYAAYSWNPAKYSPEVDRGACADLVAGRNLSERQAIGGRYAAHQNAHRCRRSVLDAIEAFRRDGTAQPKESAVADRAGVSLPTVRKYWPDATDNETDRVGTESGRCFAPQETPLVEAVLTHFPGAQVLAVRYGDEIQPPQVEQSK